MTTPNTNVVDSPAAPTLSLCCEAPISDQFHTCTDCGEHAEPVTFDTDDGPAQMVIDHEGILQDAAFKAIGYGLLFLYGAMWAAAFIWR